MRRCGHAQIAPGRCERQRWVALGLFTPGQPAFLRFERVSVRRGCQLDKRAEHE